jgi:1-acyl-sn-glycerol-3-phosphate acyltransferase
VIAGNNVINSFFMVLGALGLALMQEGLRLDPVAIFGVLAVVNVLVAIYIYTVVPEFLLRFVAWMLSVVAYRVRVDGHERIPKDGPALLVCNHVSFIDWFVLAASVKRPARFVMYKGFYEMPVINFLFRQAKCIPIASKKEDPEMLERSFAAISAALRDGQVVCIFPEGRITETGDMMPFRPGVERILAADPVPVVPIALNGLWGSFFSRRGGPAMTKPFRRGLWSRVFVAIGDAVPPESATAPALQELVHGLWARRPEAP